MSAESTEKQPVAFQQDLHLVPASFYNNKVAELEPQDEETFKKLALISFEDAYNFMQQHRPPHTPRRVTNTWMYLEHCAFYDQNPHQRRNVPDINQVKSYSFTSDFIIARASHVSRWLGASWSNHTAILGRISATFLIDMANELVHAEPSIRDIV